MKAFFTHVALVRKVLGVHRDDVALQVTRIGALVLTVWALVSLVALEDIHVPLQIFVISKRLWAVSTLKRELSTMLALYMSLQVGWVSTAEVATLAAVGLLTRVSPHVLLELRWMAKTLSTLCANMCKGFAVHSQQMPIEQALLSRLIFAVFALVQLGFLVTQDQLVGAEWARLPVVPSVLCVLWDFLVLDDELVAL